MARRVRRSCRSQSRYCGLGAARGLAAAAVSAFDMDFELLPQGIEVAVELRRVAGGERGGAVNAGTREAYRVVRLHLSRPARQHDDPLRHADRLADVVRDQDRGLAFTAQDLRNLVGEREPGL